MEVETESVVLVVDDDLVARLVLCRQLERLGRLVVEASSAEEALLRLTDHVVDVVISDFDMPGMSGLDLHRRLPTGLQARFVLLTGFAEADEIPTTASGHPVVHLTKPVSTTTLARLLADLPAAIPSDADVT